MPLCGTLAFSIRLRASSGRDAVCPSRTSCQVIHAVIPFLNDALSREVISKKMAYDTDKTGTQVFRHRCSASPRIGFIAHHATGKSPSLVQYTLFAPMVDSQIMAAKRELHTSGVYYATDHLRLTSTTSDKH